MAETIRIEIPIETVDETEPELSNILKKIGKLGDEADSAGKKVKKSSEYVTEFEKQAEKTGKSLSKWAKEKYEVLLEAKERISPAISMLNNGLRGFAGKSWSVTLKAVDLVTSPVRGIINLLKNPIFQAGAVLGVSVGLADTINTYKDFEAAMSQVQAISGATGSEVIKLTDKAKEMGATTKFTAKESAEAFNYMAMAGWKTEDMLGGIEGILSLAAASGENLATTSDIVTDALTAFGLKAGDAGHFSDVLAAAASNANTTVSGMGETFKYAGSMAGSLGYSIEDVALMTGLMANSGIKASMAGTAMNAIFTRLATDAGASKNSLGALGTLTKELGIQFYDSSGNARNLKAVMDELRVATAKMNNEEKTNIANKIAGMEASKGLLAILNASEEDYNKLAIAINSADGAAANMSETMMDNLQGSITLLQSAVDGVKISFGERLAPYAKSFAEWLTEQMPAIEQGLNEMMDWFDQKVGQLQRKFNKLTETTKWQDADFFGKVKVAWDEFIVQPFSEWWGRTGKAKFAGFAQDIGEGIGSGLKLGIMTLLGIDLGETVDEGVSIGASFAKGFSEGFDFDMISEKLWGGFMNTVSNAAKLLPGGEEADLSSLLSLGMLAKVGKPLFSLGSGALHLGKFLIGDKWAGLGNRIMGSTGNAMVGGSGMLGKLADIGYKVSGGSSTPGMYFGDMTGAMSGGTAALKGSAVAAGSIVAGASFISGGIDLYKSYKTDDPEEGVAYAKSGALKMGGVTTGAAIGTLVLPGIGTAIGAGIGGIAGWIAGDQVKKGYEEELEKAEKEAANAKKVMDVTGLSINEVNFASKELQAAMEDSEVSAEQFAVYLQEEMAKVAEKAFGDIHLSLEEVRKLAEEITFGDMKAGLEQFNTAAAETQSSLAQLKGSISDMKKQNWLVSVGMKLEESEKEGYKQSVDNFVKSAQDYIKDSHYETTVALKLLMGEDTDLTGTDAFYEDLTSQVEGYSKQLEEVMEKVLEDGVVSTKDLVKVKIDGVEFELNEAEALEELENKITEITNRLTEAQNESGLELIKIKYNGAGMDAESFDSLLDELVAHRESMDQATDDAYIKATVPIRARLKDPNLTEEERAEAQQKLQDAENARTAANSKSNDDVLTYAFDTMSVTYADKLDGILPDIEGSVSEKLKTAMNHAVVVEPNVKKWTEEDVKKWFGLDELAGKDGETFAVIYEEIKKLAETVPQDVKNDLLENAKSAIPTQEEIMAAFDFTQWSIDDLYEWGGEKNYSGLYKKGDDEKFSRNLASWYQIQLANPENDIAGYSKTLAQIIYENLSSSMDQEKIASFIQFIDETKMAEDGKNGGAAVVNGMQSEIESRGADLRASAESAIKGAYEAGFNVKAKIHVKPEYSFADGGSSVIETGMKLLAGRNAAGGYVSGGPQLSWLAEEGYGEFIIPTNPSRRSRALELYEQAGAALGVSAHAAGGYVEGSIPHGVAAGKLSHNAKAITPLADYEPAVGSHGEGMEQTYEPVPVEGNSSLGGVPVQVNVSMSPEFIIQGGAGQDEEGIMQVVRKHIREMADELGGEIAGKLEEVFSNMPLKEA